MSPHKQNEKKSHWLGEISTISIPDNGLIRGIQEKKSTRKRWTIPKTGTSGSQKRIPNSQQIWQNYSNPLMIREMKIRTLWYRFTYIQLRNHINTKNLQNWGGGHRYSHTTVNKKIGTTTNFTAPTRAEDEHTLQPSSFTSCDTKILIEDLISRVQK